MPLLRTILRRTFYTAAALSTLLLLTILILWPVSYLRSVTADYAIIGKTEYAIGVQSGRGFLWYVAGMNPDVGGLHFILEKDLTREEDRWTYLTWQTPGSLSEISGSETCTSLGVLWSGHTSRIILAVIYIPCSYLTLLFSILPLLAFRSLRRRRQAARLGLCPKCQYDLRTQQSGIAGPLCPECGTPLARTTASPQRGEGV